MTLKELKQRCENEGFQYAYGIFNNEVEPPHLIAICQESNNFIADGKVYHKDIPIQLDYTYEFKNIEEQRKIEENILKDIPWRKTEETYLSDERVWQVSYFFEIDEGGEN